MSPDSCGFDINGVCLGSGGLTLIAGPCVLENRDTTLRIAENLKQICQRCGVGLVFKGSYDKANRSSLESFRGPGLDAGLRQLQEVRQQLGVPVCSDVHETGQVSPASEVLDVMQIPAFLCRQTDLLLAAGNSGCAVNIKKGQFLAPWDMPPVIAKVTSTGNERLLLTERGSSFGYNNLVVDMRSLLWLRQTGYPLVFDATHAVQLPGGCGTSSGGQRQYVAGLSRAAVAVGVDALFWEVYPDPAQARCDGANSLPLNQVEPLLQGICALNQARPTEEATHV